MMHVGMYQPAYLADPKMTKLLLLTIPRLLSLSLSLSPSSLSISSRSHLLIVVDLSKPIQLWDTVELLVNQVMLISRFIRGAYQALSQIHYFNQNTFKGANSRFSRFSTIQYLCTGSKSGHFFVKIVQQVVC